jgi:DNA ligase-1
MNFIELAIEFSKIEETSSRLQMIDLLAATFAKANNHEAQIIAYLCEGTLRPAYTGTQFNIATKNLLQAAALVLHLESSEAAKMVQNYSDVAEMVYQNLKCSSTVKHSVAEIYQKLIDLEKIAGTGSVEIRLNNLVELLNTVSPIEAKYIIRIISKTLRLGFSTMTILDALSNLVAGDKSLRTRFENSYNMCADIGLIAYNVKKYGQDAPDHVGIKVGIPIAPAAAERLESAKAIIEKIGPAVAQLKLDGFRLQVHLQKNNNSSNDCQVNFFSRNLIDMSQMFPDLVQIIKEFDVESLICEGEAIVYDEKKAVFLPFQQTVKRKRKHGVAQAAEDLPLRLYLFDVLYLNGESLMNKSHKERRKILMSIIPKNQTTVFAIEERPVENSGDLYNFFQEVLAQNLEGLVVKKNLGHYIPGKRNFNWIKLKKHSEDSINDTLDVVVMGYYTGEGKRAAFGIGSFLIGVYNKHKDKFETIAKVGTGLSEKALKDIKFRCDLIKIDHQPKEFSVASSLYPDVWVRPEIVCVVKADEITRSPVHTASFEQGQGFALRFPRFVCYRSDKNPYDCTTTNEVEQLFHLQSVAKNSAS